MVILHLDIFSKQHFSLFCDTNGHIFIIVASQRGRRGPIGSKVFHALGFFMGINPISPKESNDDDKGKQEKIQTLLLHKPMEIMDKIL